MDISTSLLQTVSGRYWSSAARFLSTSVTTWSGLILGASITGLVGLGAYRWSQEKAVIADEEASKVNARVRRVYQHVLGGAAITFSTALASHISGLSLRILQNNYLLLPISLVGTMVASGIAASVLSKEQQKAQYTAWSIFNVSMGMMLSPLCFVNKALIAQAAFLSLGLGTVCTLTAYLFPKRRFAQWEAPVLSALTTLSLASGMSFFFPRTALIYGLDRVSLYGGLTLFSALLTSATARLLKEAQTLEEKQFDPLQSAVRIYSDGVNIFTRILNILRENQDVRRI